MERTIPLSRPIDTAPRQRELSALKKGFLDRGLPVSILDRATSTL